MSCLNVNKIVIIATFYRNPERPSENEESRKIGTTQTVPPRTRPNERRRAQRRHRNHQPPAQALHQKRTENRCVLADRQGIAFGRLCPCRTKTRRQTLPALYRTEHAADVVHPLPCRRHQTRTQTRPRQIERPPIYRQKNPRPPTQPAVGSHRRHRQTRLPPRTSWRLLRRHPLRHEIPPANPNPGRRLRLPTDRYTADRTPRHPPKRLCLRAWRIEIQTASIG